MKFAALCCRLKPGEIDNKENRNLARPRNSLSKGEFAAMDFRLLLSSYTDMQLTNPKEARITFKESKMKCKLFVEWCIRQDLNLQPSDPKSEALSN